ncbi:hypothetical protein ACQ4LE_001777 [Meloidogyne hapla]
MNGNIIFYIFIIFFPLNKALLEMTNPDYIYAPEYFKDPTPPPPPTTPSTTKITTEKPLTSTVESTETTTHKTTKKTTKLKIEIKAPSTPSRPISGTIFNKVINFYFYHTIEYLIHSFDC